jgi:hypothetical protein
LNDALDALEFFVLTPLPGCEDHKILFEKNVWMDPDMNKYELEHVVTAHAKMSKEEWQSAYRSAWDVFYTDEHLETIMHMELYTQSETVRAAVQHERRVAGHLHTSGHAGNGLSDAETHAGHHDAGHHDHHHEPRPGIIPPAA